jgi:hypothetical protein
MTQQFRGVWIPADVWNLFLRKEINATELHLLAMVDSLVTDDRGCYASNSYLADILGLRSDYVSRLIGSLKRKKLIKQIKFDGRRRYLETMWSRVDLDRQSLAALDVAPMPTPPTGEVNKKANTGSGFGFVVEEQEQETPKWIEFDLTCANKLWETVPPRKRKRRSLPKTWPEQFRLLRTADEIQQDEIERVLDWYCTNWKDQWTPKCHSAKAFRSKFDRVDAAIQRTMRDTPQIKIGEDAQRITERLMTKKWPKGSDQTLAAFVQMSLDEYDEVHRLIVSQGNRIDPDQSDNIQTRMRMSRDKNLVNYVIQTLAAPSHFVEQWFESIWKRVSTWDGWNGNLAPLSFRSDSPLFEKQIAGMLADYGRDMEDWNRILTAGME